MLENENIQISMDGRGRALDNIFVERLWRSVKYEDIDLKRYDSMRSLFLGLTAYFEFYNHARPHQSLSYKTPDKVYRSTEGGGARITDKFKKDGDANSIPEGIKATALSGSVTVESMHLAL